MSTRMQCSAELLKIWAGDAQASMDAVYILDAALRRVLGDANGGTVDAQTVETLLNARAYAQIGAAVFAKCTAWEADLALRIGQPE